MDQTNQTLSRESASPTQQSRPQSTDPVGNECFLQHPLVVCGSTATTTTTTTTGVCAVQTLEPRCPYAQDIYQPTEFPQQSYEMGGILGSKVM